MLCQVYSSESDLLRLAADHGEELVERPVPRSSYFREELDAVINRTQALGAYRPRSFSWTLFSTLELAAQGLGARSTGFGRTRRCLTPAHLSKPPVALRERLVLFMIDYDDTLYPTTQLGSAVLRLQQLQALAQAKSAAPASSLTTSTAVWQSHSPPSASDVPPESNAILDDTVPYPSAIQLHHTVTTRAEDEGHAAAHDNSRETQRDTAVTTLDEFVQEQLAHDPVHLYALCEQLDEAVHSFLTLCQSLGANHRMFIVTNADLRWVFSSSRGALPRTHQLLFDRELPATASDSAHTFVNAKQGFVCISARGRYGDLREDGREPISNDPTEWKVACFRDEIERLLQERRHLADHWSCWKAQQQHHERSIDLDDTKIFSDGECQKEPCLACEQEHARFFSELARQNGRNIGACARSSTERIPFDLFVIGDSEYEMEAGRMISQSFPDACLKTIKLVEEPTMIDVVQQLSALADHLPGFVHAEKCLNVRLTPRSVYASDSTESLTTL
jgi:hypothetical protein